MKYRDAPNPDTLRVQTLARCAKAVTPATPFAMVCERLRVHPYPCLAVVDDSGASPGLLAGRLVGVVSARSISERLLGASPDERERLRRSGTARDVCEPVTYDECAAASDTVAVAVARFDRLGRDAVPVVELRDAPYYLGMVSRSDLLRELHRPFVPPQIGGMATPLGVYLTNGAVSGGVGMMALAATGLLTWTLHATGFAVIAAVAYVIAHFAPFLATLASRLPASLARTAPETVLIVVQTALFLALLRQTPLAGYHAAEHQVVHAVERGEPLLPDVVRTMPRVHGRCSTNLVAGLLLFYVTGTALADVLTGGVSYLAGALAAFLWGRPFGSFLQAHATTRPATDAQIASGIRAARELFDALDTRIGRVAPPVAPWRAKWNRVWQAGFVQIFIGSVFGAVATWLLGTLLYPPLLSLIP